MTLVFSTASGWCDFIIHKPKKQQLERRTAVRAEPRRSMSGCSAFTHRVRFKLPLTLRQAQGERDFESLELPF
ncbi:MAG: hypothetical protein ACKN9W_04965 [Methylococcus sp.]